MTYVIVGIGGVIGSLMRYFVSVIYVNSSVGFPLDTVIVNLLGSLIIGLLFTMLTYYKFNPHIINGLCAGVIGSFTTFSAFSVELIVLLENNHIFYASIYFLVSSVGGLFLAWVGYRLGKLLIVRRERGQSS